MNHVDRQNRLVALRVYRMSRAHGKGSAIVMARDSVEAEREARSHLGPWCGALLVLDAWQEGEQALWIARGALDKARAESARGRR